MFFIIPGGGGGLFFFLLFLLLIRLIINSFGSSFRNRNRSDEDYGFHYYYTNFGGQQGTNQSSAYTDTMLLRAYETLGVSASSSDDDIKKAYRKLAISYHPDTIASKNMSDSERKLAESRFRAVQSAYETVCKARGIR